MPSPSEQLLTGKEPECCQAGPKPQCFVLVCGSLAHVTSFICSCDIFVIWQGIGKHSPGAGQAGTGRWVGGTPAWVGYWLTYRNGVFLGLSGRRVLPALHLHRASCLQRWALTEQVQGISLQLPSGASAVPSLCGTARNCLVLSAIQVRSLGSSDALPGPRQIM